MPDVANISLQHVQICICSVYLVFNRCKHTIPTCGCFIIYQCKMKIYKCCLFTCTNKPSKRLHTKYK